MPELKYQSQIDPFDYDFDAKGFKEQSRVAYRWTFKDITDARNFQPVFLLSPSRPQDSCLGWGLSLFISLDSGRRRMLEITRNRRNLFKKLGTHIAEGNLSKADGISNEAQENGHFTHFEYKDVDLTGNFEVIEEIK